MKIKRFNENALTFDEPIFLEEIKVIKEIPPLKKLEIKIKSPLLFLVGDNGTGKSTLMDCLADTFGFKDDTYLKRSNMKNFIALEGKECKIQYIDFHAGDKKYAAGFGNNISLQIQQMRASAGESTMMQFMKIAKFTDGLILLDEPCRGLSMKNQGLVAKVIMKKFFIDKCQIICSTHSDIILKTFKNIAQYYEMGLKKDVTYDEYISTQIEKEEV